MKRVAALLLIVIFSNIAVADPFSDGGGSTSSSDESNLSLIFTVVLLVGAGALFITDILSDDPIDSQDALAGITEQPADGTTGIEWENLAGNSNPEDQPVPVVAISVFPGSSGRDLANYFSSLIEPGNSLYYTVYSSPVAFGQLSPGEAAATGFSFLHCQWFVASGPRGLELHRNDSSDIPWVYYSATFDSSMVRTASASFMEFSRRLYE